MTKLYLTLLRGLLAVALPIISSGSVQGAEVCNAGVPGANSSQVLEHFSEAVANCPNPQVIVLFVGMNDAVNPAHFIAPAETFTNVSKILKTIKQLHVLPVIVMPHQPDVDRLLKRHAKSEYGAQSPEKRVRATAQTLEKAAKADGALVVDFSKVLADAGGATPSLSTDGVHLTRDGYHLLASAIASVLPKGVARVLCVGDSLTYGIGVRAQGSPDLGSASYPQQLQAILNGAL